MEQQYEHSLRSGTATVVDVRTPEEFMGGHVAGSINIPLKEIQQHLDELRGMNNIVVCCASGGRSRMAAIWMKQEGLDAADGGSWLDINHLINN